MGVGMGLGARVRRYMLGRARVERYGCGYWLKGARHRRYGQGRAKMGRYGCGNELGGKNGTVWVCVWAWGEG